MNAGIVSYKLFVRNWEEGESHSHFRKQRLNFLPLTDHQLNLASSEREEGVDAAIKPSSVDPAICSK